VAECMLCGCTESMACAGPAGIGCHWISHEPPVCSACERVWKVVQALSDHVGAAGSFQTVKRACREHREESYRCG
jgi:hypothetical protein